MRRVLALAAVVVLALSGCDIQSLQESDYPVASPSALPGEFSTGSATSEPETDPETESDAQVVEPETTIGSWRFVSGTADGEKIRELGNFTITIGDGTVSGGSICGRFVSARDDGEYFPITARWEPNTIGEKSLCSPGPNAIISNLGALSPTQVGNGELRLADDSTEMIFTSVETPEPIVNNWLLSVARDKKGRFSLDVDGQRPSLRLDADKYFVAESPCIAGSGAWEGGVGEFSLKSIGSGDIACTGKAAQALERRYWASLRAITTARLVGDSLVLTGKNVRLVFTKAAAGQ